MAGLVTRDPAPKPVPSSDAQLSIQPFSHDTEKRVIEEALRRHNGNRSAAVYELRMHGSTLWRKLKTYRIGA